MTTLTQSQSFTPVSLSSLETAGGKDFTMLRIVHRGVPDEKRGASPIVPTVGSAMSQRSGANVPGAVPCNRQAVICSPRFRPLNNQRIDRSAR